MRRLQERVARTMLDGTVDNTHTHTHTHKGIISFLIFKGKIKEGNDEWLNHDKFDT